MNKANLLSQAFLKQRPKAAADLLEEFPPEQAAEFIERVSAYDLAPVFNEMASWPAARLAEQLTTQLAVDILSSLPANDAETLLRLMDSERRQRILTQMPKGLAKGFQRKLAYPVSTVGAWMNTTIPHFTPDTSVAHCLDLVKRQNIQLGGVLIVVDNTRQLTGLVEVEKLLTQDGEEMLSNLLQEEINALPARATLWEVEHEDGWTHFPTLPVVDHNNILLGALTHSALKTGMKRSAQNTHPDPKFSLLSHMIKAFLVSLSGIMRVIAGVSANTATDAHRLDGEG